MSGGERTRKKRTGESAAVCCAYTVPLLLPASSQRPTIPPGCGASRQSGRRSVGAPPVVLPRPSVRPSAILSAGARVRRGRAPPPPAVVAGGHTPCCGLRQTRETEARGATTPLRSSTSLGPAPNQQPTRKKHRVPFPSLPQAGSTTTQSAPPPPLPTPTHPHPPRGPPPARRRGPRAGGGVAWVRWVRGGVGGCGGMGGRETDGGGGVGVEGAGGSAVVVVGRSGPEPGASPDVPVASARPWPGPATRHGGRTPLGVPTAGRRRPPGRRLVQTAQGPSAA